MSREDASRRSLPGPPGTASDLEASPPEGVLASASVRRSAKPHTWSSVVAPRTFRTEVLDPVRSAIRKRYDMPLGEGKPLAVRSLHFFPVPTAHRAMGERCGMGKPLRFGVGSRCRCLAGAVGSSCASMACSAVAAWSALEGSTDGTIWKSFGAGNRGWGRHAELR